MQATIGRKKRSFKKWQTERKSKTSNAYKQAKKHSTKSIEKAKRTFDDLYDKLGIKKGEICMYARTYIYTHVRKVRERKIRDLSLVKCTKNEDEKVLTHNEGSLNRQRVLFSNSIMRHMQARQS